MSQGDISQVRNWLLGWQDQVCAAVEDFEDNVSFYRDSWKRIEGGGGESRVLQGGNLLEKGGVNFSDIYGKRLPSTASARRPELADQGFRATGVSIVFHPLNPYVPATHANFRYLQTDDGCWWFGGGFDLTPCFPDPEGFCRWHQAAKEACDRHGSDLYQRFKEECDQYFYLPHRSEMRGVGGLFFDDWDRPDFEGAFALVKDLGQAFLDAWFPLAERHRVRSYGVREKRFQKLRRGRYVEFNLLYDRGTLFGLQSKGRIESILMSLPPDTGWNYPTEPREFAEEESSLAPWLQPGKDYFSLKG